MVVRVSQFDNLNTFLFNNRRSRENEADSIERLSTLKKVNRPSDSPTEFRRIQAAKNDISQNESFISSIDSALTRFTLIENTMENVRMGIVRTREIATQAANGTLGLQSREALASEVDQIRETIINEMNRTYEGNYLFSGTALDTTPFDQAGNYNGNQDDLNVRVSDVESMKVNFNGSEVIFGPGGQGSNDDLLTTLEDFAAAMRDPNLDLMDPANALETEILNLEPIQARITGQITDIGGKVNRLEQQKTNFEEFTLSLTETLSLIEDVDLTQEVTTLQTHQTAIQAQLRSQSTISRQSLLDFIG